MGRAAGPPVHRLRAGASSSAAGIADEISNGPRPLRRLLLKQRTAWNVVAEAGDPDADRTIVLLAHHDAPHTGLIFDPAPQKALGEAFPDVVENTDTAIPLWWPSFGGPCWPWRGVAVRQALDAAPGPACWAWPRRRCSTSPAARPCPGANDNLSGVAVLVAIAERAGRAARQGRPGDPGLVRRRGVPPGGASGRSWSATPPLPVERPRSSTSTRSAPPGWCCSRARGR